MKTEEIVNKFVNKVNVLDKDILKLYINFCFENNDFNCNGEEHHILPKSLFPEYSDFSIHDFNKTKLSYTNHLKAHYLLILSIESEEMLYAFNMMNNFYNKNNIANLENYELLKIQFKEMLKTSKWSKSNKDKKWMFKNGNYESVHATNINEYLCNGWIFQSHTKDTIWKNNGLISKRVQSDDETFKDWNEGRLETKSKNKSTWLTKDNIKKRVLFEELDTYINNGWIKGSGENKSTKNYIRISKDNTNKSIKEEELEKYINDGWILGSYKVYCSDCHKEISSLGKQNHRCKGKKYEYNFYTK